MKKLEIKVAQNLARIIVDCRNIMCAPSIKGILHKEARKLIKMIRSEDES